MGKVVDVVASRHLARGCLDVHDDSGKRSDGSDGNFAMRFDADVVTSVRKCACELGRLPLQKRLSSGEKRVFDLIRLDFPDDLVDRHFLSAFEGVGRIAVGTAQVAAREPDKREANA